MSPESVAPVERGTTLYGPTQTIDTSNYVNVNLEGKLVIFTDTDIDDPTKLGSSRVTRAKLMRNVSGSTVYAKYAVTPADGYAKKRFDATFTKACRAAGIVDDRLGSDGCRNGDLCWILFEGPAYYMTASSPSRDTAIGDLLFIVDDDGGRLDSWQEALTFSAGDVVDADLASILANSLGRAMETSEVADTDTAKLIRHAHQGIPHVGELRAQLGKPLRENYPQTSQGDAEQVRWGTLHRRWPGCQQQSV